MEPTFKSTLDKILNIVANDKFKGVEYRISFKVRRPVRDDGTVIGSPTIFYRIALLRQEEKNSISFTQYVNIKENVLKKFTLADFNNESFISVDMLNEYFSAPRDNSFIVLGCKQALDCEFDNFENNKMKKEDKENTTPQSYIKYKTNNYRFHIYNLNNVNKNNTHLSIVFNGKNTSASGLFLYVNVYDRYPIMKVNMNTLKRIFPEGDYYDVCLPLLERVKNEMIYNNIKIEDDQRHIKSLKEENNVYQQILDEAGDDLKLLYEIKKN